MTHASIRTVVLLAALVGVASAAGCRTAEAPDPLEAGHVVGSPDAPVTVIEFSDFGCPFCRMFALTTYPVIHREYIETGHVRWVYVPFVTGSFRNGDEAAMAAECAAYQDRFHEMKTILYRERDVWSAARRPEDRFASYARELGLHIGDFNRCYQDDAGRERIRLNNLLASATGIRATPTFIINGRLLEGAPPIDRFREFIETASPR